MILNNYWRWREKNWSNGYSGSSFGYHDIGLKNINGVNKQTLYLFPMTYDNINIYLYATCDFRQNSSFVIGAGNSELDVNDYAISNDITADFSNLNTTYNSIIEENGGVRRTFTMTGINTTPTQKTITEVGIIKKLYTGTGTGTPTLDDFLMGVVQLETPITVATEQEFSIAFEWIEK